MTDEWNVWMDLSRQQAAEERRATGRRLTLKGEIYDPGEGNHAPEGARAIRFRFEREVVLDPLWFDQRWLDEMVAGGLTQEQALREMVAEGWNEDWSSIVGEMVDGDFSGLKFAESITRIELVEAAA